MDDRVRAKFKGTNEKVRPAILSGIQTFHFFCLTLVCAVLLISLTIPALATTQSVPEELGSMKQRASGYKGAIGTQQDIGDIYNKSKIGPNQEFYDGALYSSSERNAVEAYVWYTLVVAREDYNEIMEDAQRYDPSLALETLSTNDIAVIEAVKPLRNKLAAQRRFKTGAAGWLAEKILTDHYKRGPAQAYYVLGVMHRSGKYYVRQSYYEAYVAMRVAAMSKFANAEMLAEEYKRHITLNQIEVAEREAKKLFGTTFSQKSEGSSPYFGSPAGSGTGGSGGWGPDHQVNRQHRDAGSSPAPMPDGVDPLHVATSAYEQGNSLLAAGRTEEAKAAYNAAINAHPTSRAALNASRQLQALTLSCSLRDDRIRRMVPPENRDRVHKISWERLQLSLKALGYYTEVVDGKPGPVTRNAIRDFQRKDLNIDDTGFLTADQRVELICSAAQNVRDPDSQIQLGIMYANGIGLNCNTAAAHAWFQKAADQKHPTALYNLGLMYLQGFYDRTDLVTVSAINTSPGGPPEKTSIRPRKIRDDEIAKYYFIEARDRGHPEAAARLADIRSGRTSFDHNLPQIVGCIDYELESELDDGEILTNARILTAKLKGQLNELKAAAGKPDSLARECKYFKDTAKKNSALQARVKDLQDYREKMGQSKWASLPALDQSDGVLSENSKLIAQGQNLCKGQTQ